MPTLTNTYTIKNFMFAWLLIALFIMMQIFFIIVCHTMANELQQAISQEQRIMIRSLFYVIAIILFPLTRLIRHISLRLNQTMPGNKSAHQRYSLTVIISQTMIASIGILGFVMFILGDSFNTLYILSGLALLGFFLYRPKQDEYVAIVQALDAKLVEK